MLLLRDSLKVTRKGKKRLWRSGKTLQSVRFSLSDLDTEDVTQTRIILEDQRLMWQLNREQEGG